jgi:flagellar biosynthesis GTPase FlhF
MQTKAYFASSVPAALEVARQELGENAMLVGSRPAPPQVRQFGRLEVTFAFDPKEPSRHSEPVPSKKSATPNSEMDEIRHQLAALRAAVDGGGQKDSFVSGGPGVIDTLLGSGFSRQTASEIASAAGRRSGDPETAVVHELTSRMPVAPFVEMKPGESRTLAFIGPPGRGKTTSLVKIAVNMGLARRVPVRIYCAGAHGIGGQEQLARFAAILGTPYQPCESLASLNLALNGEGWKGLTLIDTPGISLADRNELGELKSFFAARSEIEKHLVLRSDASSADMVYMMSRFSGLTPSRLLFTGMDEAVQTASAVEALIRGGIPATFAGTGQQIPESLEEVNADRLARAAWSGLPAGAADSTERKVKFMQAAA